MQNFSQIVGSTLIKSAMTSSIVHSRVSHAYILSGGIGFGKKILANAFAKSILCHNSTNGYSCDVCKSCLTFETGNNPDLIHIRASKANLGVTDVREDILAGLSVAPYSGDKRVYIIHNAHTMTPAAQNAMLLTLEEAPHYAVFLLLADGLNAFLPTLLSRCITYKIPSLDTASVKNYLEKQGIDTDKAQIAAELAQGSIGRALTLANDEDFAILRNSILEIVDKLPKVSIPEIFSVAKQMEQYKEQIADVLEILQMHYRQILISQARMVQGGTTSTLQKIKAINDTKQKLNSNCNFLLCMEILTIKLAGSTVLG
ncbi:MAG: DNA polymerase III subunit [Defluviitaleaceae bacterium]|nr:DNA polymerase III subunit [Defluviitaleaceae bacterium]